MQLYLKFRDGQREASSSEEKAVTISHQKFPEEVYGAVWGRFHFSSGTHSWLKSLKQVRLSRDKDTNSFVEFYTTQELQKQT